jgi:hypothetical protein
LEKELCTLTKSCVCVGIEHVDFDARIECLEIHVQSLRLYPKAAKTYLDVTLDIESGAEGIDKLQFRSIGKTSAI